MTQWHQACRIAVELNLLAIQILVARLVYRQRGKRMSQYQTDFFKIFFYKTVFEIMGFTLSFLYLRLPEVGISSKSVVENMVFATCFFYGNCALIYCQELCHLLIALDRFLVFRAPVEKHSNRTRTTWQLYAAFAVGIVSASPRLFATVKMIESGGALSVMNADKTTYAISIITSVLIAVITTATSVGLDLRSLMEFRRWASVNRRNFAHEFRLLVYSMLQLFGQLLLLSNYLLSIAAYLSSSTSSPLFQSFVAYTVATQPYTMDIFCLSSGVCLLVTWTPRMRLASTQALFAFLCVEARIGLNGLNGLNSLDPYPIGFDTEGLDLPLDDSFMNCMHGHEHRFYAGEVWTERGEIKHVDVENMENARQAGISLYGLITPCLNITCGRPEAQVEKLLAGTNGALNHTLARMYFSVHSPERWSRNLAENQKFVDEFLYALERRAGRAPSRLGWYVGVKSSMDDWKRIVGPSWKPAIRDAAMWYRQYDGLKSMDDFMPFGVWWYPYLKQYALKVTSPCGPVVNRISFNRYTDVYEEDTAKEPSSAQSYSLITILIAAASFTILLLSCMGSVFYYRRRYQNARKKRAHDEWLLDSDDIVMSEEPVGSGAFAAIYPGQLRIRSSRGQCAYRLASLLDSTSNCMVAVKIPRPANGADISFELRLMKQIGAHPNIVNLIGHCSVANPAEPSVQQTAIVLEYYPKGDLLKFLRTYSKRQQDANGKLDSFGDEPLIVVDERLSLSTLLKFCWQIAHGMAFLSAKRYVHRDLAARNILLDRGLVAKISDFGLCRYTDEMYRTYVMQCDSMLPIRWMAPESLDNFHFTTQSDVWSFGVLLYEIFSGGNFPYEDWHLPVGGEAEQSALLTRLQLGERLEQPIECPPHVYNEMEQCWKELPRERPRFTELRQFFAEWLDSIYGDNAYTLLSTDAVARGQ